MRDLMPQIILSAVYSAGFFVVLYFFMTYSPADGSGDIISVLIGVITAGQIKILDFWFGSSHGSKIKDQE